MNTVMGIMNLQERENLIKEMTVRRSLATVPFAGRYRLIDFGLSSMVNSGIESVGIMLPEKSRSVMDHLRSGKGWDLARRQDGLFYLPAAKAANDMRDGDLKNFYYNLDFLEYSPQPYILLVGSHVIYNIDFAKVLRFHQNTGADITVVYNRQQGKNTAGGTVFETAANGLVLDIARKMTVGDNDKLSMGIYLMKRQVLVDIVRDAFERGGSDLLIDGIMRLRDKYAIYGLVHDGYVAHVNSTLNYYQASLDLLQPEVWQELFVQNGAIYTKIKNEPPTKYKEDAQVKNSLVAGGCVIEGSVENSILFRGVKIGKGVQVKNSIIMQKCDLQADSLVENVICDKNVVITPGKWLKGAINYPLIVEKNVVI